MEKIVFEKLVSAWQMAKTLDDGLTNLGFTVTPVFDIEGHIADAIYYMLGEKTATFDESVTHSTLTNHEYNESQMADALLAEYRKADRTSFPKSVLTSITEAANQMGIDNSAMIRVILCEWALQRDVLTEHTRTMMNN